jgi:two-component system aerobic respiration control sensor histidine kinase ArcB
MKKNELQSKGVFDASQRWRDDALSSQDPHRPEGATDIAPGGLDQRGRLSLLSHDLRSALADVLGGVRLIDREGLDAATLAHLERIAAAGETMARLIDKTFSEHPDSLGVPVTQAVNITLGDFLNDLKRRWADRAAEEGARFELDLGAGLPAIVTLDRVALERVLSNLIGNAVKYADRGVIRLSVACNAERALIFQVTDDGPGLSQASIERLFQFAGRPTDNAKPGSGLGLYIAKELSGLMGAQLDVSNRPEGGAEARLELPLEAWFDRSLRKAAPERDTLAADPVDLSGFRILLAEDNKTNQLVATQMLGAMGATYSVASDGLEAMELLERESFDLALLDIEMPRMSGLELIRAVRAMSAPLSDMPLIALTAYVMREHRERIYGAGADGIIAKPLMGIEDLGRSILEILSGLRARPVAGEDAAPLPETPSDEVVDRTVFDALVDVIGAESTAELLAKLQADTDSVAEGLGRGQRTLDLAEIRSQTHILISVAGAIGARRLQALAQRLNTAANRNEADEIDSLCAECLSGLAGLQAFIVEEQDRIPA